MFSIQRRLGQPTEAVNAEQFWALVRAPQTAELIEEYRKTGDSALKRKLPAFLFQATFDVTTSKNGNTGMWRKQAAARLTGLVVMDVDHVDNPKEVYDAWTKTLNFEELGILLIYITPSGKGLKVVFKARTEWGNLIDNQHQMARVLDVVVDESCKDASRMSFVCRESDILFINEKELFTYENEEFRDKYGEEYRQGRSGASPQPSPKGKGEEKPQTSELRPQTTYHGVPYQKIVEAWIGDGKVEVGDRHRTSLVLADHLRYITDNDPKLIEQILRETPFVKQIIEERNEDVCATVKSAQGYEFLKGVPRRMQNALKAAGAAEPTLNSQLSTLNSQLLLKASSPAETR